MGMYRSSIAKIMAGLFAGFAAIVPAQADLEFSYVELGTFGGSKSQALDINESGQVVGWASSLIETTLREYDWATRTWTEEPGISEPRNAFIYRNGTMTNAGRVDEESEAWAINNAGRFVGIIGRADPRAFRSDFGPLDETMDPSFFHPGIQESIAWDINDNRQVVGNTYLPSGHAAFIYERNEMRSLGSLLGSPSWTRAINNAGIVVGDSFCISHGGIHAFAYNSRTGQTTDLGSLAKEPSPFGLNSHATDINERGQIVGTSSIDVPSGGPRTNAFLWDNGEMFDLGVLPGEMLSDANGINNHGDVVGRSGGRAFLWTEGQMLDLNSLVDMPDGWTLSAANAINSRGQIVGYATHNNGDERGFILNPLGEGTSGLAAAFGAETTTEDPLAGTFSASVYPIPLEEPNPGIGDADIDGDVDLADLSQLAAFYGQLEGAAWFHGDFDNDNDVDLNDLSALAGHYGSGEAQALADFARLTSVPEPASATVLAGGALVFVLACRKRLHTTESY